MDQTIRERTESLERQTLSPRACLSASSRGRAVEIAPCPMRTCFQRDIDRVVHCKSFRRLKHKTQVFLQPEGDHYRTRMTHTLEVSRIARTMARGLALNEDLAEAAALAQAGVKAEQVSLLNLKQSFAPQGTVAQLRRLMGIDAEAVVHAFSGAEPRS